MRRIVFLIFAALAAVEDGRKQSIPVVFFCVFGGFGLALCLLKGDLVRFLPGVAVGAGLLLLGLIFGGGIGAGDGLFFAVSGLYLPLRTNLCLFLTALLFVGMYGLFRFVFQKIKNNRYAGKDRFAFLPFAAAAAGVFFLSGFL